LKRSATRSRLWGGTWNRNGDILIGGLGQVQRVSDAGRAISKLPGHAEIREFFPVFLPDVRHYVAARDESQLNLDCGSIRLGNPNNQNEHHAGGRMSVAV